VCSRLRLLSLANDKQSKQTNHGLNYHLEQYMHMELHAAYLAKVDARNNEEERPARKMKIEETLTPKSLKLTVPRMAFRGAKQLQMAR
jgi:hypothetical protein